MGINKIQEVISTILLIGIVLSASFVLIGGSILLIKNGDDAMNRASMYIKPYPVSAKNLWHDAKSFNTLGIIEIGIIMLVLTQLLRIALLIFYYIKERDHWFTAFTTYIILMLSASLLWHK